MTKRCPVCFGTDQVPAGFYRVVASQYAVRNLFPLSGGVCEHPGPSHFSGLKGAQ